MPFECTATVNYCWLTVKDKSILSLLLCDVDSCWGNTMAFWEAQNSLSAPLFWFSARTICSGSVVLDYQTCGPNCRLDASSVTNSNSIYSCVYSPKCTAMEWRNHWTQLLGFHKTPLLKSATKWKTYYLVSLDGRERNTKTELLQKYKKNTKLHHNLYTHDSIFFFLAQKVFLWKDQMRSWICSLYPSYILRE